MTSPKIMTHLNESYKLTQGDKLVLQCQAESTSNAKYSILAKNIEIGSGELAANGNIEFCLNVSHTL